MVLSTQNPPFRLWLAMAGAVASLPYGTLAAGQVTCLALSIGIRGGETGETAVGRHGTPPAEPAQASAATDEDITALIAQLADPAYANRTAATRRLCALGHRAIDPLRAAAAGSDAETALRAAHVLKTLEQLWLAGTEVKLEVFQRHVAWDEPVDLTITILNHSTYPARLPFELEPARREARSADARQVGDMLDAADWLQVRGPDGGDLSLRVDDMALDAEVSDAVERRLDEGPITLLPPGKSATVRLAAINRGWARYPLLDEGTYSVVFDYIPPWNDEVLAAERAGRVVSNEVRVSITRGAPVTVSRNGLVASLILVQEDGEFVVGLTNRFDQELIANRNFGPTAPFAQGRWVFQVGERFHEIPAGPTRPLALDDFDPAGLRPVSPGESVELARIERAALLKHATQGGVDVSADGLTLHFSYDSTCDRRWQQRQGAALLDNPRVPAIFRTPLPRTLLSTRLGSNSIPVGPPG